MLIYGINVSNRNVTNVYTTTDSSGAAIHMCHCVPVSFDYWHQESYDPSEVSYCQD
jgi:phenylacetate-coenzyme A ligase PaaK-like adenylate-forming protein